MMPPEVQHKDSLRSLYKEMNNPFIEQLSPLLKANGISLYDMTEEFVEKEENFLVDLSPENWTKCK